MGIITISMKDEVEKELRQTVKYEHGDSKGALGKAIEEAVNRWIEEKKQKEIAKIVGVNPSTISREIKRNRRKYRKKTHSYCSVCSINY